MIISVSFLADEQDSVVTGVRIVEPPPNSHQALRGNLYAVVDVPVCQDPAALADRVLSAMQRTYYTVKGSQSQVTIETARQAQQILAAEVNRSALAPPWGVVVVSILPDRLAVTGVGSAFALVTGDDGTVHVVPAHRLAGAGDEDPQAPALWSLHRQKVVSPTAVLAGSGRWLTAVPVRTLAATAAYVDLANSQDAAQGLQDTAGRTDLPGLIIVAVPDGGAAGEAGPASSPAGPHVVDTPAPPPPGSAAARAGSSPGVDAAVRGLPTALNATPPVVRAPPPEMTAEAEAGEDSLPPSTALALAAGDEAGALPPPQSSASDARSSASGVDSGGPDAGAQDRNVTAGLGAALASATAQATAGARAGAARAREIFGSMLPDQVGPAETVAAAAASAVGYEHLEADATEGAAAPPKPVAPPFTPPPRATGSRARIAIAVSVILLLVIPAIVAARLLATPPPGVEEAAALLDLAEARLASGQDASDQEDLDTARKLLTEAQDFVSQAEGIVGRTARSSELLAEIQAELESVLGVIPLYGIGAPLTTFSDDADPQRIFVSGQDIYVLDPGRAQVVRYRLNADGESLEEEQGSVVLRAGDQVAGAVVGPLVDLAWQVPIPGYEDKANLLILDGSNQVFRYNQVDGPTRLDLGENSGWQRTTQLETYLDRLYALDEGANQIYRYPPGEYDQPPRNWFGAGTEVNIANARSLRIDGDIWILYADGKVVRYRDGEQVPFSLDDSVALPANPVDLWVGQDADSTLYVADAAGASLLLFDKDSGAYRGQFRAAEGTALQGLRAVFVDNIRDRLFLLTADGLYQQQNPL